MDLNPLKVAIIGAGPSGLILALALSKRPHIQVSVFEKSQDPRTTLSYSPLRSYTIDITGHGAKAVQALNLEERFDRELIPFRGIKIPILIREVVEPYKGKGWTGSRGDIVKCILAEILDKTADLKNVAFHFETEAKVLDAKQGLVAYNSQEENFDLVVGCDGAGSGVRAHLQANDPSFAVQSLDNGNHSMMLPFDQNTEELDPSYLYIFGLPPYQAVSGAINGPKGPSDPLWFCQIGFSGKRKFASKEEAIVFLQKNYSDHTKWNVLKFASSNALDQFWNQENIATGKAKISSHFGTGKVILLGDAACPFPPIGQGVNAAMEMAIVLDQCIGKEWQNSNQMPNQMGVVREAFTNIWKPEADAIRTISFHSLDLRKFHPPWFGKLRTFGLVILHKLFYRDAMTNAKREDISYAEALQRQKRIDLVLWAGIVLLFVAVFSLMYV